MLIICTRNSPWIQICVFTEFTNRSVGIRVISLAVWHLYHMALFCASQNSLSLSPLPPPPGWIRILTWHCSVRVSSPSPGGEYEYLYGTVQWGSSPIPRVNTNTYMALTLRSPPPPQPSGVNTYMALFGEGLPHLCLCLTHLHPVPGHWTPPIWGRAPPGQDHWAQAGVRGVGSPRHLSGHICIQKHLIVNIYTSHLQFQKKIIHSIFHKSAVYLNQCLK